MAHKKLTIPKCLCCGKRLTPQFKTHQVMIRSNMATKEEKTGIFYFGKGGTDSMFCSHTCGVELAKVIIKDKNFDQRDYRNARQIQLLECHLACVERNFLPEAEIWKERYHEYCKHHNYKPVV